MVKSDKTETVEVATMPDATGEMVPMSKDLIASWLRGEDLTIEDEGDELDLDEAIRILSATSEEQALAKIAKREIDSLAGQTFVVTGVKWRKSKKSEDGQGRYATMTCVDGNGEAFIANCGATKVVLQLRWAQLHNALPWRVALEVSTTQSGNTVKELIPASVDF